MRNVGCLPMIKFDVATAEAEEAEDDDEFGTKAKLLHGVVAAAASRMIGAKRTSMIFSASL